MTEISIARLDATQGNFETSLSALRDRLSPSGNVVSERGQALTLKVFGKSLNPVQVVERICTDVREQGTPALLHYCQQLDGKSLTSGQLRVSDEALQKAHQQASPDFLATVRRIRENIFRFQSSILHQSVTTNPSQGVSLEQRYLPLRRVGVCVPGGAAAYPSTVLMTVVPAQAAGVEQIAIVAPPTPYGAYNPDILAVCHELGINEVYAIGGAQAVAALAYGVDEIPSVDKIVGPGNLFVALAKRHVFGQVDIDSIAGPSEVVVIADDTTPAEFAAADLLAQAEHSPGSSIVISWKKDVLDRIYQALCRQVDKLERSQLTIDSLQAFGAMILVRDENHACEVTDRMSTEHLHIAIENPRRLLPRLRNAGATFLGPFSPVALGDYAAGPSHVLPTGGTARWASGLSSNHFLRSSSVIEFSCEALSKIASDVERMATCEGLTAHRESIAIRKQPILAPDQNAPLDPYRYFRDDVLAMKPYIPGEQPLAGKAIKLNTNENPYPPSPNVIAAIQQAATQLERYPDPLASAFRTRAAEVLGVAPDQILCGNGSDDILTIVTRAFVPPGRRLRLPYPSYILYRTLAELQGARSEEIDFAADWSLRSEFFTSSQDLKLVFLPNPNSPTGTMVSREQIIELAEKLPCPLLVDEAYVDFAPFTCVDLPARYPNIMVSRTLSKSYALAGLRFGYLVAHPNIVQTLRKVKDSYNTDALSIAGATAAIDDQLWLTDNVVRCNATRDRMTTQLREIGFDVIPSQANFVWCSHPDRRAEPLYQQLKQNGILVRYMNYPRWSDGLRISVGTDSSIDTLLSLLKTFV